ncbi:MAG TPA: T9SS type A sorting domain-containing protein, partial [Ferruginibacter sp.]|nr:T9SS type A sorting domain-containing protein [Ferruginibacter sp.]
VFEGVTADGTASGVAITAAQKATVVDAVWTINRLTGSGDCQVDLNWTTPLEGSSFTTYTDPEIGIGRFNGTDWGTATGSGNNTLNTATGLFNTFSPFIVTKMGAVLPLQLKNVYAAIKSAGVEITWNVLNETAVLRYEVEKSTNRMNFTTIGIVNAANRNFYSFMDVTAQTNLVYYRLKITGINGDVKYSDIIVVRSGNNTGISMYPNPVVNTLNITGLKNNSTIKIINASGQVVNLQRTTASSMSMNVAELKAGIYVIEILNDGIKEMNQTFIKQ